MATIAVLGTLDSKGEEHAYVAEKIRARGHRPLLIDVGSGGPPTVTPDFTREQVASSAGLDLAALSARRDRGECVVAMSKAAPVFLAKLAAVKDIDGVISLGGGGGTAIATAAMRALPLGFPKLMVSTLAAGNTAPYLGTKDIVMMPSIADVAGLNRLSRLIFSRAAGAICGMVEAKIEAEGARHAHPRGWFAHRAQPLEHLVNHRLTRQAVAKLTDQFSFGQRPRTERSDRVLDRVLEGQGFGWFVVTRAAPPSFAR